jgi:hypothetical protein
MAAMTDDILAYLMNDLSPERRAEVEEKLATNFDWQREKSRLEECLAACGDPAKCSEEPPPNLVEKTCFLVEHSDDLPVDAGHSKRKQSCGVQVAAFTADTPCMGPARSRRLADLTVGGGVMVLVGLLITPALFESREASRRSLCQNNLQAFGAALFDFQENRNHQLPEIEPGENAGRYALELLEHGLLTREQLQQLLVCPESPLAAELAAGRVTLVLPSRASLDNANRPQLDEWLKSMGGSYAYRVGYFDQNGRYRQVPFTGEAQSPLMADAPGLSSQGVRIVNHVGGQNVLDQSLSVRFRTGCLLAKGDHIYLNANGEHAAGIGPFDIVIIRSDYGPTGPLVPVGNDEIRMTNDE